MTKNEALKMAIEQMNVYAHIHLCEHQCQDEELLNVIQACKEALEHQEVGPAEIKQMLNDIEYYQKRVEALEQPAQGMKAVSYPKDNKWIDMVEQPWQDFFERGKEIAKWADKQNEQPAQEPAYQVGEIVNPYGSNIIKIKQPREKPEAYIVNYEQNIQWQGLSDDEDDAIIQSIWSWGNDFPYDEYRVCIEQALKEKNK
jgi:hypothetical protein